MPDTFTCPSCDKSYPALPTLVGRPVRCSGCKDIFRLRADGIAELLDPDDLAMGTQTVRRTLGEQGGQSAAGGTTAPGGAALERKGTEPPEAPAPTPPAPDPGSGPAPIAAPPTPPAQGPSDEAKEREARRTSTSRPQTVSIRAKHEALKRSLAQAAAAAAGGVEEDVAEPEERKRSTSRHGGSGIRKPGTGRKRRSGAQSAGFEAVTTDSGSRDARNGLLFLAGVMTLVAVVIVAAWVATRRGPIEQVLHDFEAEIPAAYLEHPKRERHYLERTWLIEYAPDSPGAIILNLEETRVDAPVRVAMTTLSDWIDAIPEHLDRIDALALWARPLDRERILDLSRRLDTMTDRDSLRDALAEAGIPALYFEDIPPRLARLGLGELEIYAISCLLAGRSPHLDVQELLRSGTSSLALRGLHGRDGRTLERHGGGYQLVEVDRYWGILMAVQHPEVSEGWRILVMHPGTMDSTAFADRNNPLVAHSQTVTQGRRQSIPETEEERASYRQALEEQALIGDEDELGPDENGDQPPEAPSEDGRSFAP